MRGIHWWPVYSPHKWPVTRKMFPFDDVIMYCNQLRPLEVEGCRDENFTVTDGTVSYRKTIALRWPSMTQVIAWYKNRNIFSFMKTHLNMKWKRFCPSWDELMNMMNVCNKFKSCVWVGFIARSLLRYWLYTTAMGLIINTSFINRSSTVGSL